MERAVGYNEWSIALLTVHREPSYIHQTLASLFCSGPEIYEVASIDVFVDGDDRGYLREYQDRRIIHVHHLGEDAGREQAQRHIWSRFCYGYCRCLDVNVTRGLIVLEDDVIVRDGFLPCLAQAVDEIEGQRGLRRYLLSLHSKPDLQSDPANERGRYHIRYPAGQYYGTQGIYYPADVKRQVRDHLYEHGVRNYRRQGDLLIKDLMRKENILYNTAWDLVEHVGEVSTGLGKGRAWLSPTFNHPWTPLEPTLAGAPVAGAATGGIA